MKTSISTLYAVIGIILLFLFHSACNKEPETIGLNILDQSKLSVYDTIFTLNGYSLKDDSVQSDELSVSLLGSLQTDDFGLTNTSFYAQLRLAQTSPDFEDAQPDSAILSLVYTGYYGFLSTQLSAKVYELQQDIYKDSTYYSTSQFNITPLTELGSLDFIPNPNDSVMQEDSTYLSAELRIPLNETFINKVMFPQDDSVLSSSDNFINYFKGIYVVTDSVSSSNEGSILYFNLINPRSKVTLYYNDSLRFEFLINSNCATVGSYSHNYSKSNNQNFIDQILFDDTIKGRENLYLQGLSGIKTNIDISSLSDWVGLGKYAINEAKLVIPIVDPLEELPPADKLILFEYDELGNIQFLRDYAEGDKYFGGYYNEASMSYEFRISLYVQSLLNGTPDYGLVLYTSGKSVNANQVVIYGTEPENPIQPRIYLNVIYTLLE